jgi:spore coat protein H
MNSPAARYNTGFSRRVCAALILLLLSGVQPLSASAYELALNCGGPDYSSATEGRYFFSDRPYTPGGAGYVGGTPAGAVFGYRIGGTNDPRLYSTYRSDALVYRFDVPNGDYLVRLYLAELVVHGPTLHQQSIAIEGVEVVTSWDQFELVGLEYATVLSFVTMVTDGNLDVVLSSQDFTALNAIAVESITPDAVPPAPPAGLAGFDSFQRNLLDWAPSGYPDAQVATENDLQGYRVYRSASPGGPYTVIGPDPLFVSRFLDDDVTPGVESYYRVTAVDVFGNESVQSPELALTPLLPSASVLPVYELTISPDELRRLQLDPLSDEYVVGDFFHGGNGRTGVGIRYRGGTTRFRSKKNYKVRFPYDALWGNRRKLNFNALFTDETLLREGLAYRLYADVDVLTPTNEHVYLQLNQEYLGIYHALEQIDIRFLEFRGLDLGSNIYKCSDNLEILPTLDDYKAAYEKETHPGSSYQDSIDLIELINLTPEADFARELSRVLDVDEYLRYYAAIIASAEQDFTRANYYLLNDLGSGLWRVIPWDNNVTFGFGSTHSSPLDLGSFQNPGWESSRLIGRLMNTPEFRYAHAQNLLRLAEGPFSESAVDGYVQTTHTGYEFNALRDWFKNGWESNNYFQSGPTDITDFCDARRAFIQTASYTLMPEVPGLIVVNEIMPLNQTTTRRHVPE